LPLIVSAPLIVALALLLLPLIPLLLATYLLYAIVLQLVIWLCWCTRGINVLLVYSNSPHWQEYIEAHIMPKLPASTVVLNWSERRRWRWFSLSVMAFRLFGGSREFNPLVVVFRPFRWAKTFRFWRPFREHKHGKITALELLEEELFQTLSPNPMETAR
jgi:hypothetical protein